MSDHRSHQRPSPTPVCIRIRGPWLTLVLLTIVALGATACGGPAATQAASSTGKAPPPAPAAGAAVTAEGSPDEEPDEEAIAVDVGPVARRAVSELYATSATLRADKVATITARTNGVVRRLLVEEGDWVENGQTLAVLEDDEQKIEYDKAVFTRDIKGRELERARELHGQGLTSEEEFEAIRREAEESRQTAEMAHLMLLRTVIKASFSGQITRRHLDVGNTVANGTAFYDLADVDPLYADVHVPERHVARLGRGQSVRLLADATSAVTGAAIERISPVVDPATGTVKVTLAVRGARGLRPGSFVRVEVVTDTHADAIVVPRSALVAEGRRWHIFRLSDDGKKVERLEVARGYEEGDRVEILETIAADRPLAAGDQVVSVGASALTDGSVVRVQSPETDPADTTAGDEDDRVAT